MSATVCLEPDSSRLSASLLGNEACSTMQAKGRADVGHTQGATSGMSNDIQAEWRSRAGSALDDLRLEKQEQYDSLNIQVD